MRTDNGTSSNHPLLDHPIDSLKSRIRNLIDRAGPTSNEQPSRLRSLSAKATEAIKAHPIAAAGIALGLGYLIVRLARR